MTEHSHGPAPCSNALIDEPQVGSFLRRLNGFGNFEKDNANAYCDTACPDAIGKTLDAKDYPRAAVADGNFASGLGVWRALALSSA